MRVNSFIVIALFLTVLMSCVEEIVIGTDEDKPIVVECVLKMQPVQTLRLNFASEFNAKKYTPVEEALVTIRESSEHANVHTPVTFFKHKEDDIWECEMTPEYEKTYYLEIRLEGRPTSITASTTFPPNVRMVTTNKEIDNFDKHLGMDSDSAYYHAYSSRICSGRHVDSGGYDAHWNRIPNYYYYNTPYTGALKFWIFPHTRHSRDILPEWYDYPTMTYKQKCTVEYSESKEPRARFVVTDHPGADDFNLTDGTLSDLRWYDRPLVTDEDHYRSRFLNFTRWALFMCPDLPLHDGFIRIDQPANFSHGLSEEDLERSYLFSNDSFHVGADYSLDYPDVRHLLVDIAIYHNIKIPSPQFSFANEVHFLSDEYDAYLRDLWTKHQNDDNFILSSYGSEGVYSNINGGVGIFGAELVTWDISYTQEYYYSQEQTSLDYL